MADEYRSLEAIMDALLHEQYGYLCEDAIKRIPAADVVTGSDFRDCRNELCLRCGQYKTAHLGSCDGCRWRH